MTPQATYNARLRAKRRRVTLFLTPGSGEDAALDALTQLHGDMTKAIKAALLIAEKHAPTA